MRTIGIYHQIDLEALDLAAQLRAKGVEPAEIKQELVALAVRLGVSPATAKKRTQVAKSAWTDPDSAVVQRAADLYGKVTDDERLALHAAVVSRSYLFFLDVLEQVGTQFQLDGTARQGTIRQRMQRRYGSKANVYQGVQKVLQTLVSWDAVRKSDETGVYEPLPRRPLRPEVAEVLIAAVLEAESRQSGPLDELRNRAALGAFQLPLECSGHGLLREYTDGGGRRVVERT